MNDQQITPETIFQDYAEESRLEGVLMIQCRCRSCANDLHCRMHGTTRMYLKWFNAYNPHRVGEASGLTAVAEYIKRDSDMPRSITAARRLIRKAWRDSGLPTALNRPVLMRLSKSSDWQVRIVALTHPEAINARTTGYKP